MHNFTPDVLRFLNLHINTIPGTTMNDWCPHILNSIVVLVLKQFAFDIANSLDTGTPIDFDSMYRNNLAEAPSAPYQYISYGDVMNSMREYMDSYGILFYFSKITSDQRNDLHIYINKLVNEICKRAMERLAGRLQKHPNYPRIIDIYNLEAEHYYMIKYYLFPDSIHREFGMVDFSSQIIPILETELEYRPDVKVHVRCIGSLEEIIVMNITKLGFDIADRIDRGLPVPPFSDMVNKIPTMEPPTTRPIDKTFIRICLEGVLEEAGEYEYKDMIDPADLDFLQTYINMLVMTIVDDALPDWEEGQHVPSITDSLDYIDIDAAYYRLVRVIAFPAEYDINQDLNESIYDIDYELHDESDDDPDDAFVDEGIYVKPRIQFYWKP